jgi:hypothetical protein
LLNQSAYLFGEMFMNQLNVILASLLLAPAFITPTFAGTKNLEGSSHSITSQVSPHQTQKLASTPNNIPTCAGDSGPCMAVIDGKQQGNKIIFRWDGAGDFYNVRYQSGGRSVQKKISSDEFTVNNVQPNSVYEIGVQACSSSFLSRSVCSQWLSSSFTTNQEGRFNTRSLGQQLMGTTTKITPVVGRVRLTNPNTITINKSICEQAQSARRRNSPAAPGLEAKCRAGEQ